MCNANRNALFLTLTIVLTSNMSANSYCGWMTPPVMHYQGRLTDPSGDPVPDNTYSVLFTIYCNNNEFASSKWSETQSVTTNSGFFSVVLGTVSPILDTVFNYAMCPEWRYLGIKVGSDPEMTPRTKLVTVPYAMRVSTVDGACGGNIRGNLTIGSNVRADGLNAFAVGNFCDADGDGSTVTGGEANNAAGRFSTISGGGGNNILVNGAKSTISGGHINIIWDSLSTIGGGYENRITGYCATIPGGYRDSVDGDFSFAAGFKAKALHHGTFVWGDSTNADFESTAKNQFLIRARGGVGINMNAPTAVLHVGGEIRLGTGSREFEIQEVLAAGPNMFSNFIAWDGIGIGSKTGANQQMIMFTDGSGSENVFTIAASPDYGANWYPRFVVQQGGNVGIGTDAPNYKLDVRGTIGNNSTLYHSDRRWKKNITTLSNSLDRVQKLRGVSYNWKCNEFAGMNFPEGKQIGLIAQEVEEVLPEVVSTGTDGYKSVDYSKLVALLIEANKEQQKQIASLQERIDELKELVRPLASDRAQAQYGQK